ncbi:MAG: hypothetical protein IPL53_13010 [Ignavibacteria bacterium]|nr:hypothetical protein [Ignavibacteria bacterium]
MRITFSKVIWVFLIFIFFSCNNKDKQNPESQTGRDFSWKSELKISDIPDTPVKGFIKGKEIRLDYINFEEWRGSGDNVLNFGDVKPKNNCGFIESDNSFHLIHKAGEIKTGELLKASFEQNLDGYVAYYNTKEESQSSNSSMPWNCALVITSMDEKSVKGKLLFAIRMTVRAGFPVHLKQ